MDDFFSKLFDTSDFPARWHCGAWTPEHGWMHILADASIFGAYVAIPVLILYYFLKKQGDLPFPRVGWFFAAFIFFCGTGHLMEALIFWWPNYRFAGTIKVGTAIASWATVIAVAPLLPRALELPGLNALIGDLEHEVGERRRAEAALRERNQDLQVLLHIISHDLREPLRGIRGLSSLLAEQYEGQLDGRGQDILKRIDSSGQRLDRLIRDLSEYTRAHRETLRREPVSLAEAVESVLERLRPQIEASGAQIQVAADLPEVIGDSNWITQAIYNLISNGIKFTEAGAPAQLEIARYAGAGSTGLAIRDRGLGVAPEARESIFDLFRRGATAMPDGTGTGLAIVKATAVRHGGDAWVEPREGGGSAFYITFADQ